MSYTPTNWQTGDIITAQKLNNMESGIAAASSSGGPKVLTIEDEVIYNGYFLDGEDTISVSTVGEALETNPAAYVFKSSRCLVPCFGSGDRYGITVPLHYFVADNSYNGTIYGELWNINCTYPDESYYRIFTILGQNGGSGGDIPGDDPGVIGGDS